MLLLLLSGGMSLSRLHAESSEDETKTRFLQSKSSRSSSEPPTTPSPRHADRKKHPSAHPSSKIHRSSGKKNLHQHHALSHEPPVKAETQPAPTTIHHASPPPSEAAAPTQITPPRIPTVSSLGAVPTLPAALPSPPSLPHGATPSAPITISKSGTEPDQGMEAAPTPEVSGGFFGWLFGGGSGIPSHSYIYLNAATRRAIDRAPVRHGRWKYIIVHNSGTREGNARVFNIYHLRVRHMKNGLAYHFVIGDGHGSGDGQIEIGHRWTAQLNGGHVASDYLNDISLGICLVGDFNRDLPTSAQISALEELISYLRIRVGKCQGHRAIIYAHKEINPRPTDCPGDRFPYSWLHGKFR